MYYFLFGDTTIQHPRTTPKPKTNHHTRNHTTQLHATISQTSHAPHPTATHTHRQPATHTQTTRPHTLTPTTTHTNPTRTRDQEKQQLYCVFWCLFCIVAVFPLVLLCVFSLVVPQNTIHQYHSTCNFNTYIMLL